MAEPLVLPEFRPTLPDLARARFGWRERTTIAALFAALALAAVALLVVRPRVDNVTQFVHHGDPTFNLVYNTGRLHKVRPQGDEIVRLQGRRGRMDVSIAVAPLRLPPAQGDIAHGLLPGFASQHIDALRARLGASFELRQEGRARVNGAPGYEVRFATGPRGDMTFGNDLMILPTEEDASGALLVTARRTIRGSQKLGNRETSLFNAAAKAYRSFKYGSAPK